MPIQYRVVQRLLGYLLTAFSLTMLPALGVSLALDDGEAFAFLYAFFLLFLLGTALWAHAAHRAPRTQPLRLRDGFVVVALFWLGLGLAGSIPLFVSPTLNLSAADAIFEAISGLTTTGATVLTGLDALPPSLLFYRQFLQWVGGLGIIVLAVAVLPLVGGGMQLYYAQAPQSLGERRLTPRITQTAKALWYLYLTLTLACGLAYWGAGMNWLDAAGHAFSTVAIGGFSTHDANLGYFDSTLIEAIAMLFMLLAGANFGLHYLALSQFSARSRRGEGGTHRLWLKIQTLRNCLKRSFGTYLKDGEFCGYIAILTTIAIICIGYLLFMDFYDNPSDTLRHGLFQVISIATTTGYTTTGYALWPAFASTLLITACFVGGCAGSTGGGMKVVRFLLLLRHGRRELLRIIHPTAQLTVRLGNRTISPAALQAVWGFFAMYITTFVVLMLFMMMTGMDHLTAFSSVAATLNNLGPGLGDVAQNYASVTDAGKAILCLSMLLGRLEVFTLLIILTPAFWRR